MPRTKQGVFNDPTKNLIDNGSSYFDSFVRPVRTKNVMISSYSIMMFFLLLFPFIGIRGIIQLKTHYYEKSVEEYQLFPAYQIPYENTTTYKDMRWTDSAKTNLHPKFDRKASEAESRKATHLLHVLDHVFKLHGIEWCLMFGTLAGQLHFHGMIPWDDDWDVVVFADEKRVKQVMSNFVRENPQFNFSVASRLFSKIYHADSPPAGKKSWSWPFVDIFYARFYRGMVYSDNWNLGTKDDIFPLRRGFFGGLLLPIPNKAEKVNEVYFQYEFGYKCKIGFDHRNEIVTIKHKIKCVKLAEKYAWVERGSVIEFIKNKNTKRIEALIRKNRIYHQVEIRDNAGEEEFFFVRY